jgi:hypothetical protein
MREVCQQLDDRTGQTIGVDPKAWMVWWSRHAVEYGTTADKTKAGKEFDSLCVRYLLVIEHGHEPGLPERFTGRFRLFRSNGVGNPGKTTAWSKTVNGVRLRLLSPAEVRRKGDSMLNVLVQNTTNKALMMPKFSLPSTIDYDQGQKRDYERAKCKIHWSLAAHGTAIIAIAIKRPSDIHSQSVSGLIQDTIVLPTAVEAGQYNLIFSLDSGPTPDTSDRTDRGELPWKGQLVSPPVAVQVMDKP